MTAKEELKQYIYLAKKVEEKLNEYKKFKDRATQMSNIISDMPRNPSPQNQTENYIIQMAEISSQYAHLWLQSESEKIKLENNMDKVEEPFRTILHKRYVEGMSFEGVADSMGYKYDYVLKQHGRALIQYFEIVQKKSGQVS